MKRKNISVLARCLGIAGLAIFLTSPARGEQPNLIQNPDFQLHDATGNGPANYQLAGNVDYRYLGNPESDSSSWGVAFNSARQGPGSVSQSVTGIDSAAGRWYRFSFRGLPQDNFTVDADDLSMRVEFFGDGGKTSLDAKGKLLYPLIEQDRRDFTINGDHGVGGAAVWRTYSLDFWLPFPQVDTLRLSVQFGRGKAPRPLATEFFIGDFTLTRLTDPALNNIATPQPIAPVIPTGTLLPLGGRWYYLARPGENQPPALFDHTNADRLLYHDARWQAPFDGNMTAWLRAGDKDFDGNIVTRDQFVPDNVTVSFDSTSMIIHTLGLPNHPTGKFPNDGFGSDANPNFIQERRKTYFIPIDPKVNPGHIITTTDNSNHALPMGPIGIAVNGVVFFNPFDAGNQDATSLMDRCCGHPAPDNTYHYHKYPICLNSPWADEGKEHSPLIGWAFDGFPIYGPFESPNVMAKDVTVENALNGFNLHWDKDRGWHYHVTPGKFPYIIGGYWGTEDPRDQHRGPPGGMGGPGGGPPPFPPPDGPP